MKTKLFYFMALTLMFVFSANAQIDDDDFHYPCQDEVITPISGTTTETLIGAHAGFFLYSVCQEFQSSCPGTDYSVRYTSCHTETRFLGIFAVDGEDTKEVINKYDDLASSEFIPAPGTCTPCRGGKQICNKNGQITTESCEDQFYDFQGRLVVGAGLSIGDADIDASYVCGSGYTGDIVSLSPANKPNHGKFKTTETAMSIGPGFVIEQCTVVRDYEYFLQPDGSMLYCITNQDITCE